MKGKSEKKMRTCASYSKPSAKCYWDFNWVCKFFYFKPAHNFKPSISVWADCSTCLKMIMLLVVIILDIYGFNWKTCACLAVSCHTKNWFQTVAIWKYILTKPRVWFKNKQTLLNLYFHKQVIQSLWFKINKKLVSLFKNTSTINRFVAWTICLKKHRGVISDLGVRQPGFGLHYTPLVRTWVTSEPQDTKTYVLDFSDNQVR